MASYTEASPDPEAELPVLRERPRSCNAVSSDRSSSSSLNAITTTPRPMSAGSSSTTSRTLVQPRSWRFLQRCRLGGSVERDRAMEEDTSLDGDEDWNGSENEAGSSVDGEVFIKRHKEGESEDKTGEGEGESSVDAVVRTKSESDIAIPRQSGNGETPRAVVFKSKAQRFSTQDDRATLPKTPPVARSKTLPPSLPLSLPSQLLAATESLDLSSSEQSKPAEKSKSQTLPPALCRQPVEDLKPRTVQISNKYGLVEVYKHRPLPEPPFPEPVVASSDYRRHSLSGIVRTHEHKTTTGTESENADVYQAKPERPSSIWDTPSRNITRSPTDDSSAHMSLSKPAESVQPLTLEQLPAIGQPVISDPQTKMPPKSPDNPQIPAKPARKGSLKGRSPARDSIVSSSSSPTSPAHGPPKPPRTTLSPSRRHSTNFESPKTSMENVLFSMGFTVMDDHQKPCTSKPNNAEPLTSLSKPDVCEFPEKSEEKPATVEDKDTAQSANKEIKTETGAGDKNVITAKCDFLVGPGWSSQADSKSVEFASHVDSKEQEIIPKKMIKIKGDKKAEEKAAKALKKEQKAKEKELKAKQKAAAKEEARHEKSRIRLFPWKVDFSVKEKNRCVEEASEGEEKRGNGTEVETDGQTVISSVLCADSTPGVHAVEPVLDVGALQSVTATTKRAEKGDGGGSKSPSDRSQDPSPPTPSSSHQPDSEDLESPHQQDDEQRDEEQGERQHEEQELQQHEHQEEPELQHHHQEQQQQHISPASPSKIENAPLEQTSSPSPQPQPCHHQLPPPSPQPQPRLEHSTPPTPHRQRLTSHSDDMSSSDPSSDMDSLSGSLRRKRQGRAPHVRICESDGETTSPDADDPHHFPGKQQGPRRHTVGGAQIREQMRQGDETDRKREAFYELLANRYPQYAEKITGMAASHSTPAAERTPRPREPQRRRTTLVTYNPQSRSLLDQEDAGTMSDVEPSSFKRGGIARASLPIVRSASSSLERPIGLVFLVFGDETKKSLLPNEITSLDTVRALFVRAFPDKLSMEFLDSPRRKIYILEATTNIFFQLEDLRDIHDRTVLKIHECDSDEPQRVKNQPESRGRMGQQASASSRPASRQVYTAESSHVYRDEMAKTQSLPVSAGQNYQELMHKERAQWEMEQEYMQAQQRRSRSRSQTPELAERPRSLSTGAPRNRYSHSPDRLPTPERVPQPLNPIPENPRLLANGFRQAALNESHYEVLPGSRAQQHHHHHPPPGRVLSPPPIGQPIYESVYQAGGYAHPQAYVSHSTRTPAPQGPQRATGPSADMRGGDRGGLSNRHSLAFAAMSNPIYESFPQRSQSYRATQERDVMPHRSQSAIPHDVNRMERMEAQIASLAAWVHQVHASPTEPVRRGPGSSRSTSSGHSESTDTYPGSSASSLSDIPAAFSLRQAVVTMDMRDKINDVQCRLQELRVELQGLKRMEQLNQEAMREAFSDTLFKIKTVMGGSPEEHDITLRLQHFEPGSRAQEPGSFVETYLQDKARVEKELRGVEVRVEALKEDVLARRCQLSVSDVEGQALQLSHVTKSLADLKARFPQVHEGLKCGSVGETKAVSEEQFLQEEPLYIETALKRCKTLTSSLVTLKRLATNQESQPLLGPSVPVESLGDEETMAILDNIRSMVPDYDARVQNQEVYGKSRAEWPQSSGSGDTVDSQRCEAPQVPAKPARLLSASEVKQLGSASGSAVSSTPSHTVTVTSQISEHIDSAISADHVSARSAFFSSMQSPPASPASLSEGSKTCGKHSTTSKSGSLSSGSTLPLPSVSSSVTSVTSPLYSKPLSGVYYQAVSPTRTRSAFSSIPLPNKPPSDKDDSSKPSDKGKKVPPPPPPRRSSAKLPYGLATGSGQSSTANGGVSSSGRRDSGERSPDPRKKDSSLSVYKASSPTSPGAIGLKPSATHKPINRFQKDIAAGIYSNLNRPDLQHQKMVPDRLITSMPSPAPAAVVTNSQDPQDEGDLSGSESTGSSTSLDSQQGVALLRANSSASSRGPKPNPPQRHSSLSAKGSGSEEVARTKTQMLQERVRKSQEAGSKKVSGSSFSQANGLDGNRNGHKT